MTSAVCNAAAGFVVCGIVGHTLVLLTANNAERPLRAGSGWTVWEGAAGLPVNPVVWGLQLPNEQLKSAHGDEGRGQAGPWARVR